MMDAKIRSGDLLITSARKLGLMMTLQWKEEKKIDPETGDEVVYKARSKVMSIVGMFREDDGCPETMLMPMREFPERRFWLPQKVIEETWDKKEVDESLSKTVENFRAEYETTFDGHHKEIKKTRPLVHIEYMVDPEQGRVITRITPKTN